MFYRKFLYSFRDADIASMREGDWTSKHYDYDPAELTGHGRPLGSILLISDLDL